MHFLCPSCILFFKEDPSRALLRIWFVPLVFVLSASVKICIISYFMSHTQFCVSVQFPKNSQKIPKKFPKNAPKIPKDSKIIHKKFAKMSSENSPKILWRFPNNSKKNLTRAYRSKSFSSLFCYTRCQTLIHTQLVVDITVLYTVQYYYFPGKNPF